MDTYKEKYEAALERARQKRDEYLRLDNDNVVPNDIEYIFPELAESEDERIRKTLIEELSACNTIGELKFRLPQPTRDECLAWLEKQKEEEGYEAIPIESTLEYKVGKHAGFLEGLAEGRKQTEQKPAEWMTKQGVTCEFDHFVETLRTLDKHGFKPGDKVIVTIRKKDD